jgi:TrmH family RNA methyltransferase
MLSAAARARLTVVLVGARNPGNIGAAARALHDFGFSDLRIVNDFAAPLEAAQLAAAATSAIAAAHILHSARRFDTLAPAIADCSLIVATTAIGERELTQPILPLQRASPKILEALAHSGETRVALLFGSEKTGLTNHHLSHAQLLTTIPLFAPSSASGEKPAAGEKAPRHLSLNLGQSVAICLYELTRSGLEGSAAIPILHPTPTTSEGRERLTQLLLEVLDTTRYTRRFPANSSEPQIRQLAHQLGATHREAETWMGILRQILWHNLTPPPPPNL